MEVGLKYKEYKDNGWNDTARGVLVFKHIGETALTFKTCLQAVDPLSRKIQMSATDTFAVMIKCLGHKQLVEERVYLKLRTLISLSITEGIWGRHSRQDLTQRP